MSYFLNLKTSLSKRHSVSWKDYIFYLFLLLYIYILIFLGYNLIIWEDEAFSLNTSLNSIWDVVKLSYNFEGQPPLYFVLLGLWRKFEGSIFFARFLSIIFILFSAFVFKKVLKLIFPKYYSIGAVVLFMINPFTVWAALEIRLYALLVLLTLSSIYLFYKSFYLRKDQYKIWFVIIGILGVYTQYYFVFLLFAFSIQLLLFKGWRLFFHYCLWSMMIAIAFSPNFIFINDQMLMHEETQLQYAWYSRIGSILSSPLQYLFPINELHLPLPFRWAVLLFSCLLFLILFYKQLQEFKANHSIDFISICHLFVPILVLLAIFNFLYSLSDLFYTQRYLTILFPFICLMFPLLSLQHNFTKILLYLAISVIYTFLLAVIYSPPYIKGPDVIKAIRYIQRNELPYEPVIFRDKSLVLVFKHYYHGDNKLIPLRELAFNLNYYKDEFNSTKEIKHLLDSMLENNNSFTLINGPDQDFIANKKVNNKDLDLFIQKNYLILADTTILGKYDYNYLQIRKLSKSLNSLNK